VVAYALYLEKPGATHLRQLFVARNYRRQGIGRRAVELLHKHILPQGQRLTVEVLTQNVSAVAFWRAVGYKDYSLMLEIMP
jgi:ribosomal protein S18 acetylase RimI-like enzyme